MKALDTNILLRFLTGDDPEQSPLVERWLKKHCTQASPGFINRIVLCELAWVLETGYGYGRPMIADVLERVLCTPQFLVEDASLASAALAEYRKSKVDYADLLIGAVNVHYGYAKTLTFDKNAAKLPGFELVH